MWPFDKLIARHYINIMPPLQPFGSFASALGATVATAIAFRGARKKSLSTGGAIAAWLVGFLSIGSGLRGFVLLLFYQIGSSATKYKKAQKEQLDATAHDGAVRGPSQVLACSILAVLLSLLHAYYFGPERPIHFVDDSNNDDSSFASNLSCAILAHHATCLADTLASELGVLAREQPRLIWFPWKRVPPGTNGGITRWGTLWTALGGAMIGIGTLMVDCATGNYPRAPWRILLFGTLCGIIGSTLDSILGATMQATYFDTNTKMVHSSKQPGFKHICGIDILTNVQVNFLSVTITTVLGGWILGPMIIRN